MPKQRHEKTPHLFPTRPAHVQGAVGVGFTPEEYAIEETSAIHPSETLIRIDWTERWVWICNQLGFMRADAMRAGYGVVDLEGVELGFHLYNDAMRAGYGVVDLERVELGFHLYNDAMRVATIRIINRPRTGEGHDHDEQA